MAVSLDGLVQRGHAYGIVDEVDSILIDEARTPLIISGEPETAAQLYYDFARIAKQLIPFRASPGDPKGAAEDAGADFEFDEKHKTVGVTPQGVEKVERALRIENLYAPENTQLVNHLNQALKAESLYHRDIDYVIQDGEVKIVDEFTGRIMEGRRWSEGLHQAIEAKEGVKIQEEHVTLATITLQNYFRLYEKLAGMTGTAKTEEKEFVEIYNLDVVEIPTNVDVARNDENDLIFKTKEGKFAAVARDIKERIEQRAAGPRRHDRRRDVRVPLPAADAQGDQAQRPEREGARARGRDHQGRRPEGRGHDRDQHGGPRRRHQARRRRARGRRALRARHRAPRVAAHRQPASRPLGPPGRSGRDALLPLRRGRSRAPLRRRPDQGDHGALQDPGRPAHGGEDPLPADRGRAEEGRGAELRHRARTSLKYDDVLNRHRQRIYEQRRQVLDGDDLSEQVKLWIDEVVEDTVNVFTEEDYPEQWDLEALTQAMAQLYETEITADELREDLGEITRETLIEEFQRTRATSTRRRKRSSSAEPDARARALHRPPGRRHALARAPREHGRRCARACICARWRRRIRSSSTRPTARAMFTELGRIIRGEVVLHLFHAELTPDEAQQQLSQQSQTTNGNLQYEHETSSGAAAMAVAGGGEAVATGVPSAAGVVAQTVRTSEHEKLGRNDPCWCGSGKKFKKCHGA